eukprot:scaffold93442_cov16-Tisochrysis_lutea.AAC.2
MQQHWPLPECALLPMLTWTSPVRVCAHLQDMQQHLPPLPSLAPCTSVVASPQMPCMMGGCPVLNGHELSPAGLAAWLEEEYDATGLARRLTPADVQGPLATLLRASVSECSMCLENMYVTSLMGEGHLAKRV